MGVSAAQSSETDGSRAGAARQAAAAAQAAVGGRGVVVEFLGLPGSGKSSVSHRVGEILAGRGLPVSQPTFTLDHGPGKVRRTLLKSRYVSGEALLHPGESLRSARALRATGQDSGRLVFKMLFNWLLVSALIRRSRRVRAVHLLDQGIYQALWSIGLGGDDGCVTRAGAMLGASMPSPDVVAVIEADVATVAKRLEARGGRHSRADGWRASDTDAFRRSTSLLEETKDQVRKARDRGAAVRLVSVDNSRDAGLDTEALRLARDIEQLFTEKAA